MVNKSDDNKQWLTELVFKWKYNCEYQNNWLNSSSVDANNEDWTGWFFWQPGICVVTDQITSWWTLYPTAGSRLSIFQTSLTKKLTYMGINLLLKSINRGLSIHHYSKKGRFIEQILTLSSVRPIHQLLLQQKYN